MYDGSLRHAQAQRPVSAINWVLAAHTHGLVWVPLFSRVFPIRTSASTAAAEAQNSFEKLPEKT